MRLSAVIESITGKKYSQIGDSFPLGFDDEGLSALFESIISDKLLDVRSAARPFLVNISGIPGAGKSTYCHRLISGRAHLFGLDFSSALYLAFDDIMCSDRLQAEVRSSAFYEKCFGRWEVPARIAGYELLRRAVRMRLNILFEHSSALAQHVDLFRLIASDFDYEIYFAHIKVDIDLAKRRVLERTVREDRRVDSERIIKRDKALMLLLPEYQKLFKSQYKLLEQWELFS
ncbi:MAG: ATP-binding protein [Prevotellaceae bacterium]|jgi:probable phosphoglycerate mutase|nr:ATP-binding protein [Prevotellaceae bacterium]